MWVGVWISCCLLHPQVKHGHEELNSAFFFRLLFCVSKQQMRKVPAQTTVDILRQQVTGGKLGEITEEAKSFAVGNRGLASLLVHTPAGEIQRQIRNWLAENFDFLSVTDDTVGGATGQLELLSTAIMDGWMAGLGSAMPPSTDALGQLLSEYAKRVNNSQLQNLKVLPCDLCILLPPLYTIQLYTQCNPTSEVWGG
ncbi:hypothetical protein KY290_009217 [Solanum tuberosum]|uniref:Uncharacterized protein n=1 Tax=Solanum tuberosum TaxID=4113 RepID=A0ABQ7WAL6_SOLTU|nr:hypothetical protein KY290_009217 [Solanum tuberosum]